MLCSRDPDTLCKGTAMQGTSQGELWCSILHVQSDDQGDCMPYLGLQVLKLSGGINGRLPVPALVQLCLPLLIGLRGSPCRLKEDLCAHRAHQHIWVAQRHFFLQKNSNRNRFLSTHACPRP